ALGPPPEDYPDPAQSLPRPPNDHLSYALTWYGLAATLLVVFLLYARKVISR
ncbi:MAG TPA: SURF1 family cytochrome oxidase biogenesis protein, partial [Acetobacteraceae bacterium]|nr:SURF1 family cytochrome oxidase biogenesis protein [Acetobacteraceae bacterium]